MVFIFIPALLLFFALFGFWFYDPTYMKLAFVLYHSYPVFLFMLIVFLNQKFISLSSLWKWICILVPLLLFVSGYVAMMFLGKI